MYIEVQKKQKHKLWLVILKQQNYQCQANNKISQDQKDQENKYPEKNMKNQIKALDGNFPTVMVVNDMPRY